MPNRLLFGAIPIYGVLIAAAIAVAVFLCSREEKRLHLPQDTSIDLALWLVPAAIIGARLYYVAFQWEMYAHNPIRILYIWEGGLAIYGGVIAGVLAAWAFSKKKKIPFGVLADLVAPTLILGQAIGRWGNFLNQEAYGALVQNPKLQFFPLAVWIEGSGWHWAAFFYESVWCALVTAFILIAERKNFFRRSGDAFGAYLLLYGLERALVEGLRTDSLYLGPIRVSQLLSLGLVLFVCIILAWRGKGRPLALLPAVCCILLGAALAMESGGLSTIFAVTLIGFSGAIYKGNQFFKDA